MTEWLHFHFLHSCIGEGNGNPLQWVLAWRIPGTGEPGGLPSMGSHRVGHDWSDLAAATSYISCLLFFKDFQYDGFIYKYVYVYIHTLWNDSVQFSCFWLFVTPWTAADQTSLSITNSRSLLKLMSIELVVPSNHLIVCRPLFLLPSIFFSIRVFSSELIYGLSHIVLYGIRLPFHYQSHHNWALFRFGSVSPFFLELFLQSSLVTCLAPTNLGSLSYGVISFFLFILFMGFSRQGCWSGLPFPSPVEHV